MAKHYIPKNAGTCVIFTSRKGNPVVSNNKSGKNKVSIACRNMEQAEEVRDKINNKDHNGTITC